MKQIFGRKSALIAVLMAAVGTAACSFHAMAVEPLKPVGYVDLERFMGPWYVISSTPTFIDKESFITPSLSGAVTLPYSVTAPSLTDHSGFSNSISSPCWS